MIIIITVLIFLFFFFAFIFSFGLFDLLCFDFDRIGAVRGDFVLIQVHFYLVLS